MSYRTYHDNYLKKKAKTSPAISNIFRQKRFRKKSNYVLKDKLSWDTHIVVLRQLFQWNKTFFASSHLVILNGSRIRKTKIPLPANSQYTLKCPAHHNINMLVQILAAGCELLGGGELEVPELVLHPRAELVRVPLSFRVELHADRCILGSRKEVCLLNINK